MTTLMPCGTYAAWMRHRRRHEKACGPCAQAAVEQSRAQQRKRRAAMAECAEQDRLRRQAIRDARAMPAEMRDRIEGWRARESECVEDDRGAASVLCAARCGSAPAVVLRVWAAQDELVGMDGGW